MHWTLEKIHYSEKWLPRGKGQGISSRVMSDKKFKMIIIGEKSFACLWFFFIFILMTGQKVMPWALPNLTWKWLTARTLGVEKVGTRDAVKAIKKMQCLAVSWDAELTDKELLPVSSAETTYETCTCTHESARFTHMCAHKSARCTHTCAHESARFIKSKEKGEYNGYFQNVCVSLSPSRRTLQ